MKESKKEDKKDSLGSTDSASIKKEFAKELARARVLKGASKTKALKILFIKFYYNLTGNIAQLCKNIGIDRQTYYNWMNNDKNFKQQVKDEQEALIDFAESKLFNLINARNPIAIFFYLKTKAKHRGYIESMEHKVKSEVKVRHEFEQQLDEYFEEKGTDGILKFFSGLSKSVAARDKRPNH